MCRGCYFVGDVPVLLGFSVCKRRFFSWDWVGKRWKQNETKVCQTIHLENFSNGATFYYDRVRTLSFGKVGKGDLH